MDTAHTANMRQNPLSTLRQRSPPTPGHLTSRCCAQPVTPAGALPDFRLQSRSGESATQIAVTAALGAG
ncbi:hypothetical protein, partial [Streptomyces ipomoeae]|uniref:hypothetical protein n=1 Tax=Streptomyces ipomoeae TaxID=103232 RepID=UPI0029B12335